MVQPINTVNLRKAKEIDLPFIHSLSAILAAGAKLAWHTNEAIQTFQDDYIAEMMAETTVRHTTLIAERDGVALGFIHVRESKDDISGEECGTVPLLAVTEAAQGAGIGKLLMEAAESWSREKGFRLLHLEVFSTNDQARYFYDSLGFKPDTINMIKALG